MVFDESFNAEAMTRIRAKLYAVSAYFAFLDFRAANPQGRSYDKKKGVPRPLNSYALSPASREAHDYYTLSLKDVWEDDAEAQIKAYMLRLRSAGYLDRILEWEKEDPARYNKNPWRTDTVEIR